MFNRIKTKFNILILFSYLLFSCSNTDTYESNEKENNWIESTVPIYKLTEIHNEGRFPNIISDNKGNVITSWGKDSIL